ncbi:MAG: anthranilate phosphoribosyltransferase, partial [Muribaculaceae bacterium]|nr:anthranilate phosphoribosyltransferase [Muribaculaceae bacterium]
GDTVEEAAAIFDDVLANRASDAKKNCVIANAAFAIHTLDPELSIRDAVKEAKESLESGAALDRFNKFVELNS